MFKVVNSKDSSPVDPDDVLIDNEHATFASVNGYVTVDVLFSKRFHLTLVKTGYVQFEDDFTAS